MAQQSSWSREGARLLSQEHGIRLALAALLAVFVVLAGRSLSHPLAAQVAVLLMVAALLLSRYGIREARRVTSAQQFHLSAVALAVLDLIAVTLLLFGTGGTSSGFFTLYLVSLIFAAIFFRGLEMGLLTLLAVLLYTAISWNSLTTPADVSHLGAKLVGLIIVAWYAYALADVVRREEEARDQLLSHLTEGVLVFDANQRLTLVNDTMLAFLGGRAEVGMVGATRDNLAAVGGLLGWAVADVGRTEERTTRVGSFPDAGRPLVECHTIPCGADRFLDGWVVVCKDLRDQAVEPRPARSLSNEKLSPLPNLRALTQALYGMAEYVEEGKRWQAIETIQEHTRALQGLLADMLRDSYDETPGEAPLDLSFVEIPNLLQGTRRLLEIGPGPHEAPVEVFMEGDLPDVSADRVALSQAVLHLCKGLLSAARRGDKLVIDVRAAGDRVVFALQLANNLATAEGAGAEEAETTSPEECGLPDSAQDFGVIEQHDGSWSCSQQGGTVRRVMFELPIEGPRKAAEEDSPEREAVRAELAEIAAGSMKLDPALAAEVSNELKNALNVIRGYAELALSGPDEERKDRALELAINLSDQAAELVDSLHPAGGQFPREEARVAAAVEQAVTGPGAPSSGTILVVDDDSFMRQLLVDTLEGAGYQTASAEDGQEALDYLQSHAAALVFVDLSMPRLNGVEMMREARLRLPGMPVVLMTGYAYNLAMQALGDEKPYAVIGKPFAIKEVMALVKAVMGQPV